VPFRELLEPHRGTLDTVAERLNKDMHPLRIEGGKLRVFPRPLRGLLAGLGHLIRNAADHGIEPKAERLARAKDPRGSILIRFSECAEGIELVIADDGRGIGLSAVLRELRRLGGEIVIFSDPGQGTRVRIRLPRMGAREAIAFHGAPTSAVAA
jgi:chemotaxis protein histidine kinase CheA